MFDNWLVELTFANRGFWEDYLTQINNSAHRVLANTEAFITRLYELYQNKERVVILSDFDMDGISAGSLGYAGLAELGFNVALYIPDPTEGYGFDAGTIRKLWEAYPDVRTIITCDVGITCYEGIQLANALGIEVLLTDHHARDEKGLPAASCIVNPKCEDPKLGYVHQSICGAYVLYQLLESYAKKYCTRQMVEQIRRLRVFAGIGTISDSMPLLYENRKLVSDALSIAKLVYASGSDYVVNNMFGCPVYRRAFKGLYLVLKAFETTNKIKSQDDITSLFFAFYVAPMFNSVKRMGNAEDMKHAFGVFFGTDPEASVDYLMKLNGDRKVAVAQYFEKLQQDPQPYAPYVYFSDANPGILGLLAQKQSEMTGKPCCVVTNCDRDDGSFHGSGRSVAWYPLRPRAAAKGFFLAGHDTAFGVGFKSVTEIRRFCDFIETDLATVESTTDLSKFEVKPDFVIAHDGSGDTVIDIVLFMDYIDEMSRLGPFGAGFPAPQVLLKFKASSGEWHLMGSTKQHLSVTLEYGFKVILFNQANRISLADTDETCYVMGYLSVNKYKNTQTVQFMGDFVELSEGGQ